MSLVAYDNSSEESETEEINESPSNIIIHSINKNNSSKNSEEETSSASLNKSDSINHSTKLNCDTNTKSGLFSKLPTPKSNSINLPITFQEEVKKDSSKIHKKQPVKILIPSLSELQEEDIEDEVVPRKKLKPSSKGSTLFSILPPPKNNLFLKESKNLIPNVLTRKPVSKSAPSLPKINKNESLFKEKTKDEESEHSDSEGEDVDFFSLTKEDTQTEPLEPIDILAPLPEIIEASAKNNEDNPTEVNNEIYYEEPSTSKQSDSFAFESDNQQLSDEAIEQLCGRRGKRIKEQVNIIDVDGDSLVPDSKEWLIKQLSEEQERRRVGRPDSSSRGGGGRGASNAHRRKHQITYLAFQAKENEIELQNQWAQNRMSRKQTQSKYGF